MRPAECLQLSRVEFDFTFAGIFQGPQRCLLERLRIQAGHILNELAEYRAVGGEIVSDDGGSTGQRLANDNSPAFVMAWHNKQPARLEEPKLLLIADKASKRYRG